MAFDQQHNMRRLRAEIELKRSALAEERSALQKLQNEIASFASQYDRTIGPLEAVVDATGPREPTYFDLVKVAEGLDAEIAWTRSEHSRVLSSPLMSLKIEASIARSQGRDLLREIAAKIRGDLDAARVELAELRRIR